MKIRVKFYKETGKWYDECVVEIQDDFVLDSDDFKKVIVDNQTALLDGWEGRYYVVVDGIEDSEKVCSKLFFPEAFAGMVKKVI